MAAKANLTDIWTWTRDLTDPETASNEAAEVFWRMLIGLKAESKDHDLKKYRDSFIEVLFYESAINADNAESKERFIDAWASSSTRLGDFRVHTAPRGDKDILGFRFAENARGTRFFVTKAGRMGLGPRSIESGDQVSVLNGAREIFILRKLQDSVQLMGIGYVHGHMHGESLPTGDASFEEIVLG